jgi:hypothetical protein
MAGSVGIEPTSSVLETGVMPLYELPIRLEGQYFIYLIIESKMVASVGVEPTMVFLRPVKSRVLSAN